MLKGGTEGKERTEILSYYNPLSNLIFPSLLSIFLLHSLHLATNI